MSMRAAVVTEPHRRLRVSRVPRPAPRAWAERLHLLWRESPEVVLAMIAGIVARFVFWQMTHRLFEDGLTTISHARNAAEGLGLTSHPGEGHVHGFTSAISVLVPLLGELVKPGGGGFVAIRLASMAAVVIAIYAAHLIGRELRISRWAMLFPIFYLALDQNQIFYGMSGMETEIAVAILLVTALTVMRDRLALAGAMFGLCILVRPDFILFIAPSFLYLLWPRRRQLRTLAPTVASAVAVAAPWFIFTTIYYGSPIPNTIFAKIRRYVNPPSFSAGPEAWIEYGWHQLQAAGEPIWHAFTPFLEDGLILKGPASSWLLGDIAFGFIVLALAGTWRLARVRKAFPLWTYALIFFVYRVLLLPPSYYEWYMGPFMAVMVLLAGAGLTGVRLRIGRRFALALASGLALAFAWHMPYTFVLEANVQKQVENRVRRPMAEWLHANVPNGQSVTAEPAGYISWFGRVKLFDYPGLTSPTSVKALSKVPFDRNNIYELIRLVHPDWIVFRPNELAGFAPYEPSVAAQYHPVIEFKIPPGSAELSRGGVVYINIDTDFVVLRSYASEGRTQPATGAGVGT
jgi:Dolichyl-phosphate-mannose-protein mannosyltransferase